MKIAVIGSGYVGLVAGACFADSGTTVVCVDRDERKLRLLEKGEVPFYEPRLADIVKKNWPDRLTFSSDLKTSIRGAQAIFIAVGTPPLEDGSADLSHVLGVAREVATAAEHDIILVTKSTVPVGTNQKVLETARQYTSFHVSVVSNPEFLKEGDAVNDFMKPDRIVIGTNDDRAFEIMSRLYAPFNRQQNRVLRMSPQSAEIVKYASNSLLAAKISFMNEIAQLCDITGGDVEDVRIGMGSDKRIGMHFLYAGLGFGGSCFPKDLRALVDTGKKLGVDMAISRAATETNKILVGNMLAKMERELGDLRGKTIAVWGLAFKPKTDDVREAPALALIAELKKRGARVRATDPQAMETALESMKHSGTDDIVSLTKGPYEACEGADALVVATEWSEYRNPDLARVASLLSAKWVFDGRNALIPEAVVEAGLNYQGVGRPSLRVGSAG
ncbi:MAG TPA: UDP-glucose/GDP-mannose dehydrogenase family protein [Polyangiaceae bacterium]|nr:UDP-glucose/GDP-mannose dehydrogenase family protein [Polyangiaceae bacterium]